MNAEVQLLISFAGILGAGLSAYIGVRVAIAEMKVRQDNAEKRIDHTETRLDRLENMYFK